MVTEREEKLAAARKKLARFQQTKTAGHQRPPSQQPKLESIGRGVEESNSSNDQTRNTSPDSLNGINPNPTHNLMYSNPTPTFEESDFKPPADLPTRFCKDEGVFPMVAVSILPHAKF